MNPRAGATTAPAPVRPMEKIPAAFARHLLSTPAGTQHPVLIVFASRSGAEASRIPHSRRLMDLIVAATLPADEILRLARDDSIVSIEPETTVQALST